MEKPTDSDGVNSEFVTLEGASDQSLPLAAVQLAIYNPISMSSAEHVDVGLIELIGKARKYLTILFDKAIEEPENEIC